MMPTCDYCWTPYQEDACPVCAKEHKRIGGMPSISHNADGHKKGKPTLDVQEGNRHEHFSDSNRWSE
jgi:hypothetical protein